MTAAKARILIARHVPPNVAARAQVEFEAILADHDVDTEGLIAAVAEFDI